MANEISRFDQGFEAGLAGWKTQAGGTIAVQSSGFNGVTSLEGTHHAVVNGEAFTNFGNYSKEFAGGYTTRVSIYLDTGWTAGQGFDYTVASNDQTGTHLRDFIFQVSKDASTGKLLIGASNNSGSAPSQTLENGHNAEITTSGWYTFEHTFFAEPDGTLGVTMKVLSSDGLTTIFEETRNNVADQIADDVGGNRYGWFATNTVPNLAIDNTELLLAQGVGTDGVDTMVGSAADETFYGSRGKDTIDGGAGNDTFDFAPVGVSGAFADLSTGMAFSGETNVDRLINIENLSGTVADDSFVGNAVDNVFFATTGVDDVDGAGNTAAGDTFDSSAFSGDTLVDLGGAAASATGYAGAGDSTALTGIENATTGGGNDILLGTAGDNVLIGNGGNDTFTGNGGSDTISGGAGLDTAVYGAVQSTDFSIVGGNWTLDDHNGVDTLSGVEVVSSTSGKFLLVGNGGYATIQDAIDAAANGDTILISEGVYTGDLTISDRAISMVGVGNVEIRGQISVFDDMVDGDVLTFKNISIDATGEQYGIYTRIDSVGNFGEIVLDGVDIQNANQGGFFYRNSLNGSNPQSTATVGAVTISDSNFYDNGHYNTGAGGRAQVHLFGFNGDLTIEDTDFSTAALRADTGAVNTDLNPQKAIVINGVRAGVADVGPYLDAGDLKLSGVTIEGNYSQDVIAVYNVKEFDSIVLTDVTIDARGPWGLVNFDGVGGAVDLSGISGINSATAVVGSLQGLATADILTGTDGNDALIGRGGADVLEGGAGDDLIIGGSVAAGNAITDEANSVVDTAVLEAGTTLSWNGTNWVATSASGNDTLFGIERVTIGSDVYLLVDKAANGGFGTIQSAIDFAVGGETILIAAGDYSESASYNPSNNTNTQPSNPVGLLINKSVTLQGVDGSGLVTDSDDVVATIKPSVQSNWGTQVFVTAADVSIIGLGIEALSTVDINKIVEVIADNFTLSGSTVGAADGVSIGSAIYVNDDTASSNPAFVSDIEKLTIDGNELEGDIVIANGTGLNTADPQLDIINNVFVLNAGSDEFWNWGIIITGNDDAVAWRPANVIVPNVVGNTFTQGYTSDRILFVRGDQPGTLVDIEYVEDFLAANDTGTFAYVTTAGGEVRYINVGTTEGFAVHRFAGNASADALAGDTLIVSSGTNNDAQIITVDNLTVVGLEGSTGLNLELGSHVETLTLGDYEPGEGVDAMVTGNADHNVINGNSGDNVIIGGGESDDLSGGDGSDSFIYESGADFGATETVDGGDGLNDSVVFRPAGNDTLTLSSDVTGIESVMIEANTGVVDNGIDASVDASSVGNALAFFGDKGDNTFTGTGFTDSFSGGDGTDTVVEASGAIAYDTTTDTWSVGGQSLNDIEVVEVGAARTLLVGHGGFATIQEAINAANANDTILISEGDYTEKLVINTEGLTLRAVGEVNILGTLHADLGIAANASTTDFFEAAAAYSTPTAGSGIVVSASGVTLSGLNVNGFHYGINLGEGTTDLLIEGVDIIHTIVGINKSTAADISDITINDGSITDSYQGIVFAKSTSVSDGFATGITIDGTLFEDLGEKGIYVETLSNSTIRNITMNNVGQFGRGDAFGDAGQWGAGIDINLKYGTYTGTILIEDFAFTDVGLSNGAGSSHFGGAAITVKGRDDATGYSAIPADVTGLAVTVQNGTINGTSTGIRLGEPGKANSGVNTTGPNLTVTNVVIDDAQYELDNVSKSVLTVTLDATDDNAYDASNAATATGSIVFNGNALANTFTGAKGNDVFNGNGGADHLNGGEGDDTFNYATQEDAADDVITGGDGQDTLAFTTTSQTSIVLGANVFGLERVTIAGAAVNLDASAVATGLTLVGTGAANIITGTKGSDTIQAGGGADTVQYTVGPVGAGSDTIDGGTSGSDVDTLEINGTTTGVGMAYSVTGSAGALTIRITDAPPAGINNTLQATNVEKLVIRTGDLVGVTTTTTLSGDLAAAGITGTGALINVIGGAGNDVVDASGIVGAAKLVIALGEGDNTFIGGRVDQTVTAGSGLNDMIDFSRVASGGVAFNLGTGNMSGSGIGGLSTGNTGFEKVLGSDGNDLFTGSNADETFYASLGNDTMNGRGGIDTYNGSKMTAGFIVDLSEGMATDRNYSLYTHSLIAIENVVGTEFNDDITGNELNNFIDGRAGADTMSGGAGDDYYIANSAGDVVIEAFNEGHDTIQASRGTVLGANVEDLILTSAGNVNGTGNELDNVLTGNVGNNILDGKAGADTMIGGDGSDTYVVDNVNDVVTELQGLVGDVDQVNSSVDFTLGAFIETLFLTGSTNINGTGNSAANMIRGNAGNNIIDGGAGLDTLTGGNGNDTFVFHAATDNNVGVGNRDIVTDFKHLQDKIDLTDMSADVFTYRGQATDFGADTHTAKIYWAVEGSNTIIYGDADGDQVADFQIQLNGNNLGLTFNDFLL